MQMDTSPISTGRKLLSCKKSNGKQESSNSRLTSTPKHPRKLALEVNSPDFLPNSQENNDDIDVVWDWNSPQVNEKKNKRQKRLRLPNSPKPPPVKRPNMNHFDKLRKELEELREQLAVPDDEKSLCLSPLQEEEFKNSGINHNESAIDALMDREDQIVISKSLEDIFNDSDDEELLLISQQVETVLVKGQIPASQIKICRESSLTLEAFSDSDELLQKITEDIANVASTNCLIRTQSDKQHKIVEKKLEIQRTRSFDVHNKTILSDEQLKEIEKKRLEALSRRKKPDVSDSVSKCSAEEIERKRLQALAKLEAKKQQDAIERKRQEALKRLQSKKNESYMKNTLLKGVLK